MFEVTIKLIGYKGVTKHLFTSKAKAERAAENARSSSKCEYAECNKIF